MKRAPFDLCIGEHTYPFSTMENLVRAAKAFHAEGYLVQAWYHPTKPVPYYENGVLICGSSQFDPIGDKL